MFECRACIRRCLGAIIDDSIILLQAQRQAPALLNASWSSSRGRPWWLQPQYSTAARQTSRSTSKPPSRPQVSKYIAEAVDTPKHVAASYEPLTPERKATKALRAELKYIKDPLNLADRVQTLIKEKDIDKAFALVRLASRDMQCAVSWNYLVDYQMAEGKVTAAVKTYNEMKKRAQAPDSFTYTILLRGLAQHSHYPHSLGKALGIYHSLFAPNSKVKPTIIHTNAVLKVCSRAKDMDSMWGIAAKLPEAGRAAPDCWTWTTILNTIRENAIVSVSHESEGDSHRRWQKAVMEGRKMWDDIVRRWRKGDLWIDEPLVCAMGRLLLIGQRPDDRYDVFRLVEQTTRIPNLVPPLEIKPKDHPRLRGVPGSTGFPEDECDEPELQAGGEFAVVKSHNASGKRSPVLYAEPGRNLLSMIMETCSKLGAGSSARKYWKLLTGPDYKVKPDSANFTMYLTILRPLRASRDALEIVRDAMPGLGIRPTRTQYHIAMRVCARDRLNPNCFDHASQLILLLSKHKLLSVHSMELYLEIASQTRDNAKILQALQTLDKEVISVNKCLLDRSAGHDSVTEALLLVRKMIGCLDQLLADGGSNETYAAQKSKLSTYVTKWMHLLPKTKVLKGKSPAFERREYQRGESDAEVARSSPRITYG